MMRSAEKPMEINGLDRIVKELTKEYDDFVAAYEDDGTPPTEDQGLWKS